ncbi:MAG: (Fe-S)-binding protein [Deltaproteobacteria bacterium]|nr:(Fe-S)-binding protein [Deltaproteobacteria bacterium]
MMTPILLTLIILFAFGIFFHTLYRRFLLLRAAQPEHRFDRIGERIWNVLVYAFGQKKFLRDEQPAGLMHFVIFWGFLIVAARTLTLFGQGYDPQFYLPGLHPDGLGGPYLLLKDLVESGVIVAVLIALYRWLFSHPSRLFGFEPAETKLAHQSHWEALVILFLILGLMVTDFLYDGGRFALESDPLTLSEKSWAFVSSGVGLFMGRLDPGAVRIVSNLSWWAHIFIILTFLNLLPRSKHFHIITAIPNVFFRKLEPAGALGLMDLESSETYGTSHIDQFTWKQVLDMYSCTECGRCSAVCPATASGKALAPRQLLLDLRDYLYSQEKEINREKSQDKDGNGAGANIVGENLIHDDVLWACTTCRACEEACPVLIEFVDKIVDMRRYLIQEEARFPSELNRTFKGMETQSNPWGIGQENRDAWAEGLEVPRLPEHPNVEYLYYVGCAGSFDDRNKKSTLALVKILKKAGVDFAILGKDELCNGETARRIGNEYLFQTMARSLIDILEKYGVKKILTNCPHCFNTLRNEYPQLGGKYEVSHAAEFVHRLIREGKITLEQELPRKVTYHDSCYYGRYNQIYDAPREVIQGIRGAQLQEMKQCRHDAMCCGAGGGWMWMEEPKDKRVNHIRVQQALETDPDIIAVSCPYCMTMMEDGLKAKGMDEKVKAMDVMELVERTMK